jgi:hypothetical protein
MLVEDSSGKWCWTFSWDDEVLVAADYRLADSDLVTDNAVPLRDAWRLADAVTLKKLRSPINCLVYVAASLYVTTAAVGQSRFGYVIDQRGIISEVTASRHPVGSQSLGAVVRQSIYKRAAAGDKTRIKVAQKSLGRRDANNIFSSGVAAYLMQDMTKNRLGSSAEPLESMLFEGPWTGNWPRHDEMFVAWEYPTEKTPPPPTTRLGTAAATALNREAFGRANLNAQGSNRRFAALPEGDLLDEGSAAMGEITQQAPIDDLGPSQTITLEEWRQSRVDELNRDAGWGGPVERESFISRERLHERLVRSGHEDDTVKAVVKADEPVLGEAAASLFARLPARQHEAMVLKWVNEKSPSEIAALMRISVKTVYNLLEAGARNLQENLAGE